MKADFAKTTVVFPSTTMKVVSKFWKSNVYDIEDDVSVQPF